MGKLVLVIRTMQQDIVGQSSISSFETVDPADSVHVRAGAQDGDSADQRASLLCISEHLL
jgi:hypothetical protein